MRFFVIAFAVIAAASAASLSSEYLPPIADNSLPSQEYLPPASGGAGGSDVQSTLADDGYRYKTVRRLRLRHRRDVSELPSAEYLPPAEAHEEAHQEAVAFDAAPAQEQQTVLADDGYRYKTVRRLKYRRRRDVNELPSNEYLPPAEAHEEAHQEAVAFDAAPAQEQQTVLADDGYRYKTVRRLRFRRRRRDVNELPSGEYLPPAQEVAEVTDNSIAGPAEEQTVLADDGYRYKVVRRLRLRRRRRDVNELPSAEYLPPAEAHEEAHQEAVAFDAAPAQEQQTVLADDGYRYKTVRRLRYRRRRDVNELPSNEYLPPAEAHEEAHQEAVAFDAAPAQEQQTVLADDGYRYKTVRRLRFRRRRRDVNELPSNEYLPPAQEIAEVSDNSIAEAPAAAEQTVLADDGYRYKVVRRLRFRRRRRDASEVAPSSEYLPPAEAEPVIDVPAESGAQLADDGYRYKTVRRLKYRRH